MARYVLRYFFSPGSTICLWSANDEAHKTFDYPVELTKLNLPENLVRQALYVMAWYDTSIDWNYPSDPSPWPEAEWSRFRDASQQLLSQFRQQLGPEFEILNESFL